MKRELALLFAVGLLVAPARANADQSSGPNKQTITSKPWGTVYFDLDVATASGFFQVTQDINGKKISYGSSKNSARVVSVSEPRQNQLEISDGDQLVTIESRPSALSVRYRDGKTQRTISVQRRLSTTTVAVGDDTIEISNTTQGIKVAGKRGNLTLKRAISRRTLSSKKGTTTITNRPDSGFVIEGVPIKDHPYVGRGIYISVGPVGVFLDIWAIAGVENPTAGLVEWQSIVPLR